MHRLAAPGLCSANCKRSKDIVVSPLHCTPKPWTSGASRTMYQKISKCLFIFLNMWVWWLPHILRSARGRPLIPTNMNCHHFSGCTCSVIRVLLAIPRGDRPKWFKRMSAPFSLRVGKKKKDSERVTGGTGYAICSASSLSFALVCTEGSQ